MRFNYCGSYCDFVLVTAYRFINYPSMYFLATETFYYNASNSTLSFHFNPIGNS